MNYYFLLEDEKSFIKVLPKWLIYMGFDNVRVADIKEVKENCYIMQSGQGVTQLITRVLYQTIDTIQDNKGVIDELVVILDSEQYDADYRKKQVIQKIKQYAVERNMQLDFSYKVFVCNHCFETWLLGNASLYPLDKVDANNDFWEYYVHYNIRERDPELMLPPEEMNETIAAYHFHYLHEMCRYNKIRYSKKKPEKMAEKQYFNRLIERIKTTPHLQSFLEFYSYFCKNV